MVFSFLPEGVDNTNHLVFPLSTVTTNNANYLTATLLSISRLRGKFSWYMAKITAVLPDSSSKVIMIYSTLPCPTFVGA